MAAKRKLRRKAASREGYTSTTVAFPPRLYRELKIACLDLETTLNELLRTAAQEYLDRHKGRRK